MNATTTGVYFSDVFAVDPDVVEEYGAFDVSLVSDLPLFVDPFLLFNSDKAEYRQLHDQIIEYLRFLRDRSVAGSVPKGLLEAWFTFREVKQNWLGFSRVGNSGSGLGRDFASALHRNLHTVFKSFGSAETVTRGNHLEKLCLIKDGVGRDNISDFATTLIKDYLLLYTERFARRHIAEGKRHRVKVSKVRFNYGTESWESGLFDLPWFNGDYVILTPKDLLTRVEVWINRPELLDRVDDIAAALPNESLRAEINNYLHSQLSKKPAAKEIRAAQARTVEQFPALIDQYIRMKEDSGDEAESVSRQRVREAEVLFIDEVRALRQALAEASPFFEMAGRTYDEARARVAFLKDVIENKDGYRIFYLKGKLIEREEHVQILYRLTWYSTPSDVNREVNNGRGPVDVKISRGAADRTLVEFKLASNRKLKQNLAKQVEIYQKASDAPRAIKVITYFTAEQEDRVHRILADLHLSGNADVVLIDARQDNKPSASVAT